MARGLQGDNWCLARCLGKVRLLQALNLFFEEVSKKHNITLARSIKADYDEFENLYSQL